MMDNGFVIADLLEKVPASYAIPPFSQMNCQQFEENEVTETQNIARVRIHVRHIKENNLFDKVIPPNLTGTINQLWTVSSLLTNFRGPLFSFLEFDPCIENNNDLA